MQCAPFICLQLSDLVFSKIGFRIAKGGTVTNSSRYFGQIQEDIYLLSSILLAITVQGNAIVEMSSNVLLLSTKLPQL